MTEDYNVDEILKDHSEPEQKTKKVKKVTLILMNLFVLSMLVGCANFLINQYEKLYNLDLVKLENEYFIQTLGDASRGIYYDALLNETLQGELTQDELVSRVVLDNNIKELDTHALEYARYLSQTGNNLHYLLEVENEIYSTFPDEDELTVKQNISDLKEDYQFIANVVFNEDGTMKLEYLHGVDKDFFLSQYNKIASEERVGIKNANLTILIPNYLTTHDWIYSSLNYPVMDQLVIQLSIYVIGLGSFVGLIVLLTPYRIMSQLILSKLMNKLPIELSAITVSGLIIGTFLVSFNSLIPLSVSNELSETLVEQFMLSNELATLIVVSANLILWVIFFASIFMGIYLIKQLFVKGLFGFLRDHSLIYKGLLVTKRQSVKTLRWAVAINFKEKHTQRILLVVTINFILVSIMCCLFFFGIIAAFVYSIALYVVADRVYKKLRADYMTLVTDIEMLAQGQLDIKLDDNYGVFNELKDELLRIQLGFKHAVSKEVKSQRMKTELIANVSHDLKTPLTSIVTYVDLLKDETLEKEKQVEYLEIIDRKADRLKVLIDDLFEMSKASSGNIILELEEVNIISLLKQTVFELEDNLMSSNITVKQIYPSEKVQLKLDSLRTYRIFENLILNISKYSLENSRAYVEVIELDDCVQVIFKNISAEEITVTPDELKERFVRGDEARHTEGSGLGLAICQTFVQLQGGTFDVMIDGDLFKAIIEFKK